MKHHWKRNSSSSTLFIESHWYIPFYSPTSKKLQFPLQNKVVPLTSKQLQNFPGEKALSHSYFPIFKLQLLNASFSPSDAWSFSFSNASYSDLWSVCDHETLGNWSVSGIMLLQLQTSFSILPRSSHTSAKRVSISSYHGGSTGLLETACIQFTSMV